MIFEINNANVFVLHWIIVLDMQGYFYSGHVIFFFNGKSYTRLLQKINCVALFLAKLCIVIDVAIIFFLFCD
jgi:hypothetical protein